MTLLSKTRVLTLGASAALAAGVISAGVVMAQDGDTGTTTPTPTEDSAPHRHGDGECGHLAARGLMGAVIEASGLDPDVFKQGFEDDKTVSEILSENGLDPAAVQADALTELKARLDERVADGIITQEQADDAYAAAEDRIAEFMDSTHELRNLRFGGRLLGALRGMLGSAADALGIEATELADRLRGGDTVADIASEQGIAVDTVIDEMVADAEARIDQAVADGKIDQARADTLKANLRERVTTFVNEGPQHDGDGSHMRGDRQGAMRHQGAPSNGGPTARFGR